MLDLKSISYRYQTRVISWTAYFVVSIQVLGAIPTRMPEEGLDPSWAQAINIASANAMLFGEEIVFTYGPLASIVTGQFHPELFWGHLLIVCIISSVFAASLLRLQTKYGVLTPIFLCVIYYTIPGSVEYRFAALMLIFFLAFLPEFDKNGRRWVAIIPFGVFAFFPLIKGTLFIVWMAALIVLLGLLLFRRGFLESVLLLVTQGAALGLATILVDQPWTAYMEIIRGYFELSSGYSDAMSIPGVFLELAAGSATAVSLAAAAIWIYIHRPNQDGLLIVSVMSLVLLFLSFKSGFVRHDGHALMFWFTALVVLVVLWNVAEVQKVSLQSALTPIALLALVSMTIHTPSYNPLEKLLSAPIDFAKSMTSIAGAGNLLANLRRDYKSSLDALASEYDVGAYCPGVSDVFPWEANAASSSQTWNPRPIFQSYTAYSSKLRQMNIDHIRKLPVGSRLIVSSTTIDGRVPLSDEPEIWNHFRSMYKIVSRGSLGICIEKIRDSNPQLVSQNGSWSEVELGKTLHLNGTSTATAIQVTVRKTPFGNLMSFLIKPTPVYVDFLRQDNSLASYRFIITDDPIIIPVLIENDDQLVQWLEGEPTGTIRSVKIHTPTMLIPEYEGIIEISVF